MPTLSVTIAQPDSALRSDSPDPACSDTTGGVFLYINGWLGMKPCFWGEIPTGPPRLLLQQHLRLPQEGRLPEIWEVLLLHGALEAQLLEKNQTFGGQYCHAQKGFPAATQINYLFEIQKPIREDAFSFFYYYFPWISSDLSWEDSVGGKGLIGYMASRLMVLKKGKLRPVPKNHATSTMLCCVSALIS